MSMVTAPRPQVKHQPPGSTTFNVAQFCPGFVRDQLPTSPVELAWSKHAIDELGETRFDFAHHFNDGFDPELVDLSHPDVKLVEVSGHGTPHKFKVNGQWTNIKVYKAVVRVRSKGENDLVMVIAPGEKPYHPWRVVTVWRNHMDDNHATLKVDRVVPAPVRL